jgi:mono/diheme cytochrome c family protein
MKKKLFVALVLAAVILTACGGAPAAPATPAPVPADYAGKTNPLGADAATAGAEVYKMNCESCHGPQGRGDGLAAAALDPAPKNLVDLQKMPGSGDDFLFWRIATGKEGTAMVPWKGVLTDEQIWQTVAFVRTLK